MTGLGEVLLESVEGLAVVGRVLLPRMVKTLRNRRSVRRSGTGSGSGSGSGISIRTLEVAEPQVRPLRLRCSLLKSMKSSRKSCTLTR